MKKIYYNFLLSNLGIKFSLAFFSVLSLSNYSFSQEYFSITGQTNICADGITQYTYSNGVEGTVWTVTGGQLVSSNVGSSIIVTWNNGTGSISASYSFDGGNCWWDDSTFPPTQYCDPPVTGTSYPFTVNGFSSGNLSSGQTACGSASGILTLTGHVGNIVSWEQKQGTGSWTTISNTTNTFNYNVSTTTEFRVKLNSGSCTYYSSPRAITIIPVSVGGSISGANSTCNTPATGILTLSGHTGSVVRWERNNGGGWVNIANTTTTLNYSNITVNTSYRVLVASGICSSVYSQTAAITIFTPTVAGTISGLNNNNCGPYSGTLTLTGYVGTIQYWGYSRDDNSYVNLTDQTNNTLTVSNVSENRSYFAVVKNGACQSASAHLTSINVDPLTVGGTTGISRDVYDNTASGKVQLSETAVGNTLRWEKQEQAGWLSITNVTKELDYVVSVNTKFRAIVKSGVCPEQPSTISIIRLFPKPVITSDKEPILSFRNNITLSVNADYINYQWYLDGLEIPNANSPSVTIQKPGAYSVRVKAIADAPFHNSALFVVGGTLESLDNQINAVSTTIVLQEGIQSLSQVYNLPKEKVIQSYEYFDGLGRSIQQISVGSSPLGNDVIVPTSYSKHGLVDKSYLPYVVNSSFGIFRENAINKPSGGYAESEQYLFYQNADKVAHDTAPFSHTEYKNDPSMQVTEQSGVGADWQFGTGHTVKNEVSFNDANFVVRYWTPDGITNSSYPNNSVIINTVTDENGNKVLTCTNNRGQVVLKRVENNSAWHDTYYVYDDYGRLIYEIPPKAVEVLGNATNLDCKAVLVSELIFQYVYDNRSRLIEKKVPGQGWHYFVYDRFDRLVLSQDPTLRTLNYWGFTKYDRYDRTVYTGYYASTLSRGTLQTTLNNNSNPKFESEALNATYHGYSNVTFPTSGTTLLTVNYYDHYDFNRDTNPDFQYNSNHLLGQEVNATSNVRNFPTGSKVRMLSTTGAVTSTWLTNVIFYDKYDRPIQSQSNNHLYTTVADISTNVYDFSGRLIKSKLSHYRNATTFTHIIDSLGYDHSGRVLKQFRKINNLPKQLLVQYEYNELGQVVDKKLHETTPGTFIQSVDFRYNIRGWLTSINNASLTANSLNTDTDNVDQDYFGMEYLYNSVETGLNNTAYYNGNISAVKWQALGNNNTQFAQRAFNYTYDKSDRLTKTTFKANTPTGWLGEVNTLNEEMTYDVNGNILTLTRNQNKKTISGITISSAPEVIDQLQYSYQNLSGGNANTNVLTKVEDLASTTAASKGFVNGVVNGNAEYTYDTNGSITKDENKGISSITYNMLGLQQVITFSNGKKIEYVYDATGNKRTVRTLQGTTLQTNTNYCGIFVYEGTTPTLSFFSSPGGRVVRNGSNFEYQYAIADHQGNTRVLFTSAAPSAQATTVNFEATTNANVQNYTRFDFDLFDHTDPGTVSKFSQRLTGQANSQIGVAKTYHVVAGDKIKIEAWAKYTNPQATTSNLTGIASNLASAFGLSAASTGEALKAYNALSDYGNLVASGSAGRNDNGYPKLFVNILLFDKNYILIDATWQQINGGEQPVGNATKLPHDYLMAEITAKEAGFAYVYISNENPTLVDAYFDDVVFTLAPTRVIQYNEYYSFGMSTANSWNRPNALINNFLYNGPTETNATTGWGETMFRPYDPAIARFQQIDIMASKYGNITPYNYALNNPLTWNDPTGLDVTWTDIFAIIDRLFREVPMDPGGGGSNGGAGWSSTGGYTGGYGYDAAVSFVAAYNQMFANGGGGGEGKLVPVYSTRTVPGVDWRWTGATNSTTKPHKEKYIIGFEYKPKISGASGGNQLSNRDTNNQQTRASGPGWWDSVKAWFSEDGHDSPEYKAYMADRASNPEKWKKIDDRATAIGMSISMFTPGQSIFNIFKLKGATQATEYTFTKTAAAHIAKRPYMNSPLLIQEIMATGKGTVDASFKGGLNWRAAGSYNGSQGIWELGMNPETGVIYHFVFKSIK